MDCNGEGKVGTKRGEKGLTRNETTTVMTAEHINKKLTLGTTPVNNVTKGTGLVIDPARRQLLTVFGRIIVTGRRNTNLVLNERKSASNGG